MRWLRRRLGPAIDRVARAFGQPATRVRATEYVGTVRGSTDALEAELDDGGFSWDPVSLYHYTPGGRGADGSWAYRSSPFADRQVHVVLFSADEGVDVYAHDEYNWLRHPREHAAEVDIRREKGAAEVRRWLDGRGVAYDREPTPRRRLGHAVGRVRRRLRGSGAASDD